MTTSSAIDERGLRLNDHAPDATAPAGRGEAARPTARSYGTFAAASAAGVGLFLTPIHIDGKWTIGVGWLTDVVFAALQSALPAAVVVITVLSACGAALTRITRPSFITDSPSLTRLLQVGPVWLAIRVAGAVMAAMIFFRLGPEWLHGAATGTVILNDLAALIIVIFLIAGLLLPLLTDFGLMEFVGALTERFFRTLFRLPGRAAVDAAASWMGSGTVGVLITTRQYQAGYYTGREAAAIATNFSIVSTAFCYAIASVLGVERLFIPYYVAVIGAGVISAMILPRVPPLSRKPDAFKPGVTPVAVGAQTEGSGSALRRAVTLAARKAAAAPPPTTIARTSLLNVLDIWFSLLPGVIAIGAAGMILAEHTPLFTYLGAPFALVLQALGVPEAQAAAPTLVVGFADIFLPALVGANVESEFTRFIIAIVSTNQLLYMSELGVLILRSGIPLNVLELIAIFLLRTVIALPIALAAAHLVVGL